MSQLPHFSAVILDLDGLILDTETTYFAAWKQAAETLGYDFNDSLCAGLSGVAFSVIETKLAQHFGEIFPFNEFYALSSSIWRASAESDGIAVKKGAKDLLRMLRMNAIPYCLATNSPEVNARECLHYAGIDHLFTTLICRDHVKLAKPAPDLFLRAAKILNQPIENCIVIEDSLTGVLAANNANAFSVLVPSMLDIDGQMRALANVVVSDLNELSMLLQSWSFFAQEASKTTD